MQHDSVLWRIMALFLSLLPLQRAYIHPKAQQQEAGCPFLTGGGCISRKKCVHPPWSSPCVSQSDFSSDSLFVVFFDKLFTLFTLLPKHFRQNQNIFCFLPFWSPFFLFVWFLGLWGLVFGCFFFSLVDWVLLSIRHWVLYGRERWTYFKVP